MSSIALSDAVQAATACSAAATADSKKEWGQFFTAAVVAEFMADLLCLKPSAAGATRVLDPGAGVGILGLAAASALLNAGHSKVHLVAVEREPVAIERLRQTLGQASSAEPRFTFEVLDVDFLDLAEPALGRSALVPFDGVISNPPYFKVSPSEARGGTAPNIYARFMEVASKLLAPNGRMVFIVPRSFASGLYFKKFRRDFHRRMALTRVHTFESRRDAFKDQGVLQENIVVVYEKGRNPPSEVVVSSSEGASDLQDASQHRIPYVEVLEPKDPQAVLHLPSTPDDLLLLRAVKSWPSNLRQYGLEISTGPVVPFRATEHLIEVPTAGQAVAPLLWMQHVRSDQVVWPVGSGLKKPEHIAQNAGAKLLVPNKTYILLRRFSAKEEPRRLTAAILPAGQLPGNFVGIENHVNFIHRPGGLMDLDEATGLTMLLNSELLDGYFRIVNGNTQVNATEIRAMPLPPWESAVELGRRRRSTPDASASEIIMEVLGVQDRRSQADLAGAWDAKSAAERERSLHPGVDGWSGAEHPLA